MPARQAPQDRPHPRMLTRTRTRTRTHTLINAAFYNPARAANALAAAHPLALHPGNIRR